ncbi:unnamed protein product, partial [Rotaria sordida]
MYTNNNIMPPVTSSALYSSNTSYTSSHQHLLNSHNQRMPLFYTSALSSSQIHHSKPTFQQHIQYPHQYQSQPHSLSPDEWDLILSFRMMRNLNPLPSFQSSSPSAHHNVDNTISYQASYPSYQTGPQMQSSAYYTTVPTLLSTPHYNTTLSIYPHTISTASSSLPQFATDNPSPSLSTTSDSSPMLHHTKASQSTISFTTHAASSPCYTTANLLQTHHTATTFSSASLSVQQELETQFGFLQAQLNHQKYLPTHTSPNHQNYSPTQRDDAHSTIQLSSSHLPSQHLPTRSITPQSPLQKSSQHLSPQLPPQSSPQLPPQSSPQQSPSQHLSPQSSPQQSSSQSTMEHLYLHSPTSTTTSLVLISPMQQQQKLQNQASNTQSTAVYQYDPLLKGPTIQLLDTTKPYEIGDTIKVGGRILQSDPTSMKYWLGDDLTITETVTGSHILNMAGYSYLVKNSGKNFTTWECEQRRNHQCSRIIIRSSDPKLIYTFRIYSIQGDHIHEPTPNNIEIRKFKQRIRTRCLNELSNPRSIYDNELLKGKYTAEMLKVLPTFYNIQSQLFRIRQENLPKSPTDLNFVLHAGFKSTDKGERFLIYDSKDVQPPYMLAPTEAGRLLIYASDLQLSILAKSHRVGSDGTFQTSASIVQQNYIIMAELEEKYSVPTVFCLCEKKNYETYQLILQVLKISIGNLKLDFTPRYWISDYEDALVKAIKQEIMALGFLPAHEIKKAYQDIIKPQIKDVPTQPVALR